jgi:hypothetical protein
MATQYPRSWPGDENTSTLSMDVARVEEARRKEYEKIEQVNAMYKSAKALGFPERVTCEVENPYYVMICIPNCFNPKHIDTVVRLSAEIPSSFVRYKLRADVDLNNQFLYIDNNETEVPGFVIWLLVCMKLFYRKDWDGRKWIDEKEAFKFEQEYLEFEQEYPTTFSEASQISKLQSDIMEKLAEKLAKDLDDEITRAVRDNPEHSEVRVGNTIYKSPFSKSPFIGGV